MLCMSTLIFKFSADC